MAHLCLALRCGDVSDGRLHSTIILGLEAVGEDWRGLIRVRTDGLSNNHEVLGGLVRVVAYLSGRDHGRARPTHGSSLVRSPISGRLGYTNLH